MASAFTQTTRVTRILQQLCKAGLVSIVLPPKTWVSGDKSRKANRFAVTALSLILKFCQCLSKIVANSFD